MTKIKNKKIGIFIGSLEGGGAERVVLNLVNYIHSKSIPVVLILRKKKGEYLKYLDPNVEVYELDNEKLWISIFSLKRICINSKIDVLLSVDRFNNIIALLAGKILNIPIIVREASTFDGIFNKSGVQKVKKLIVYNLMKILYPSAKSIIANSEDTYSDILKYIPKIQHVNVINNPIVNDELIKRSYEDISDSVFEKAPSPRIISIGRFVPQKNFPLLIKCFSLIKKDYPKAQLFILGKGPDKNKLMNLIAKLNLDKEVHFLGYKDNPYKYLRNADVFVLSSKYEGFGNVLVEALAVGLPVVSTSCSGGPREILADEKYGILADQTPEDLANAVAKSLQVKINKDQLIERSLDFTVEVIGEKYIKLLLNDNLCQD